MNNWMWIVLLIPVVIWILSTVIRPEEPPRRRFPPRDDERAEPRRGRPPGEVERFLEEINRLRRRTGEEQQRPPETPPARPEIPRPVPRRVVRPTAAAPRPRPQPVSRAVPLETQLGNIPVPASPSRPPAPVVPARGAAPVLDVIPVSRAPALASIALPVPEGSPAAAIQGLFRNPQTLAAAIILHEVLGPPRCKRRRWSPSS
jgi:hypothetical protein